MKVLVTGAGGMVGSHMVEILKKRNYDVLGTYYKPTVNLDEIDKSIKLVQCDVRYFQNVLRIINEFRPDKIFHLAAQSFPTVSWEQPFATIDTNINGTISVFESIKFIRANFDKSYDPIVVVACSSAEYGTTLDRLNGEKVKENAELLPLHPYGVSKVGQDLLSYQYYQNDKIKTIRARIFNTTGDRKIGDVCSDFTRRAVEQEKQGNGKYVLKVGNLNTYRAIMDYHDLISALILLSEKGTWGEAYNICAEKAIQMKDIVAAIEKYMNIKFTLDVDKALLRPTDEKIIIGDVSKLKKDTGWEQKEELESTIKRMIDDWRQKCKQ